MNKFFREFICVEEREYTFRIGKMVASCLAGFAGGAVFASIFWGVGARLWRLLFELYG